MANHPGLPGTEGYETSVLKLGQFWANQEVGHLSDLIFPKDYSLAAIWKTKYRRTGMELIRAVRLLEYPGKRRQ